MSTLPQIIDALEDTLPTGAGWLLRVNLNPEIPGKYFANVVLGTPHMVDGEQVNTGFISAPTWDDDAAKALATAGRTFLQKWANHVKPS